MVYRILVVDDEQTICHSLKEGLSDLGYLSASALSASEALSQMAAFKPHFIFLDLRLGSDNGLKLIPELRTMDSEVIIFMMTAYGDVKTAVEAIKAGAYDYLHKPFEFEELDILIRKGIEHLKTLNKLSLYADQTTQQESFMIGEDESLKAVRHRIRAVASSERTTVLIQGETGTGKELVAAEVHALSPRKEMPFVKINCGAIPPNLMESELFGFEKNAFTGANARKKGLLELADGGTVFLDEIGELPLELQSKLLRFLEDQRFKRIGSLEDLEVDVRVLAATNRDLKLAIQEKTFREDLYYRLNVFPIQLPPLRERGRDIFILASHFMDVESRKHQRHVPKLSAEAERCMLAYRWPGNIRELKNVIERTLLLYPVEVLEPHHLPPEIAVISEIGGRAGAVAVPEANHIQARLLSGTFSLDHEVKTLEQVYIESALSLSGQQISKAADFLGISRFALKRKLEKTQ
jgi:two-component system response regulator AtoC